MLESLRKCYKVWDNVVKRLSKCYEDLENVIKFIKIVP